MRYSPILYAVWLALVVPFTGLAAEGMDIRDVLSELDASRYMGSQARPTRKPVRGYGNTRFDAVVTAMEFPRETLERVLPPNVKLARAKMGDSPFHPVIALYGRHRDSIFVGITTWKTGYDYRELILLIPFVQYKASPELKVYVHSMYLTNKTAVELGNSIYGYNKKMAPLTWEESVGAMSFKLNGISFDARVDGGEWNSDSGEGLARLVDLLKYPILGNWGSGEQPCSDWFLDLIPETRVRQVAVQAQESGLLEPGVSSGHRVLGYQVEGLSFSLYFGANGCDGDPRS